MMIRSGNYDRMSSKRRDLTALVFILNIITKANLIRNLMWNFTSKKIKFFLNPISHLNRCFSRFLIVL